jgi:hypothetical protein
MIWECLQGNDVSLLERMHRSFSSQRWESPMDTWRLEPLVAGGGTASVSHSWQELLMFECFDSLTVSSFFL